MSIRETISDATGGSADFRFETAVTITSANEEYGVRLKGYPAIWLSGTRKSGNPDIRDIMRMPWFFL